MQLLLDISTNIPPSLDNFAAGKNEELVALLRQIATRKAPEHAVYLWGEFAVGKTHLLQALALCPPARYIDHTSDDADFLYDEKTTLYLLDDCQKLSPEKQIAAFNLFNDIQENKDFLVVSGATPASIMPVRDDLRSRLSWGISYHLHKLTDQEKMEALKKMTQDKGIPMAADVLPFLITRYPRDMRTLSAILDALDRYSLQTRRTVTLPLLREMVQANQLPLPG